MHIPRTERSIEFIARGASVGLLALYTPVVLLTIVVGVCCSAPYTCADVAACIIRLAELLGIKPDTVLMLSTVVPLTHAVLLHINRRDGVGGGRWLLYMSVFCAPVVLTCIYYAGMMILVRTPYSPGDINHPAPAQQHAQNQ